MFLATCPSIDIPRQPNDLVDTGCHLPVEKIGRPNHGPGCHLPVEKIGRPNRGPGCHLPVEKIGRPNHGPGCLLPVYELGRPHHGPGCHLPVLKIRKTYNGRGCQPDFEKFGTIQNFAYNDKQNISKGAIKVIHKNPFAVVSKQNAVNLVSIQHPENPIIAVSTEAASLTKPATSSRNVRITKTYEKNIKSKKEKIEKDSMGVTITNQKIKKDSIRITKTKKNNKKDSMGITKTEEKIEKDSIRINKTHEKIIKSKKNVQKRKIKRQSITIMSRNEIRKNQKTMKIAKNDNITSKKNRENTMCAKNQKDRKINTKKRIKTKAERGQIMKLTLSKPNRNMTQPEITNIDNNVLNIEGVLEDIMSQHGPHLWEKQLLKIVTQYDDKNNRTRIYTYRKAIVLLQDRLHKKDDPHMIRVIIKKILKSYKKRLDVALDTLTSTPASSDDENADNDTDNRFNILPNRPPSVYEVLRKVDETHSVETTKNPQKNVKADQKSFMEVNNIKKRKIIFKKQKNYKPIKKIANKKLTRSAPNKAQTKQPLKITFPRRKSNIPLRMSSKTTKIQQQKQYDKNNSFIKKRKKEEIMTHMDISNIDCIVESWRYTMCVACAVKCNASYLHDLYLASTNCQNKCHLISNRTSILKGFGKFKAAVDFINATRKVHTEEFYEARYYAQNAIQTSNKYDDNLNLCVKKLAMNILDKISIREYKHKSLAYFTLTELIILSSKSRNIKNIKKKIYPNLKFKKSNSNQTLDYFDKKNALTFETAVKQRIAKIAMFDPAKNKPKPKKLLHKKNNLLLGGSRKKRTKRINYSNLAKKDEIEDIAIVQINNKSNNDEEWKPELNSDVSEYTSDISDDERIKKKKENGISYKTA